jgi:hypothetical protein
VEQGASGGSTESGGFANAIRKFLVTVRGIADNTSSRIVFPTKISRSPPELPMRSSAITPEPGHDRQFIRLQELPNRSDLIPPRSNGRKLGRATVWRWTTRGVAGVVLRTVNIGGAPATCAEWLNEFFEAIATARRGQPPVRTGPTINQRSRQIEKAERRLIAAGL